MRKSSIKLTTSQFAKRHKVNKRTLHYYDSIGLFTPHSKGENGYRYYDNSQSIDFEYIHMLKELNMTIDEIKNYYTNPTPDKFLDIVNIKEKEINEEIQKLKNIKKILQTKKEQILFCKTLPDQHITIEEHSSLQIYTLPFDFNDNDISHAFSYINDQWSIEQIRMGVGSFISIDKIKNSHFDSYDGLFSPVLKHSNSLESMTIPQGKYLCGYQKGTWDHIPEIYQKMLEYAKKHHLQLMGYAFEIGINEFVVNSHKDYITKIMIKIEEK